MKRKLVMLLTLALTVAFVGGCGKGSQAETSNGSTSKKTETLSEYLSKEKTIAYVVSEMDKAETPRDIYFFEKGKLTIIPGEEFGMTLGDFSQMKDKEIWEKYETVRETYIAEYKANTISAYKAKISNQIGVWESDKARLQETYADLTSRAFDYSNPADADELLSYMSRMVEDFSYTNEDYDRKNTAFYEYMEDTSRLEEGKEYFVNEAETIRAYMDSEIETLNGLLNAVDESKCATPFCDIPFEFVIATDSSGNNVQSESMIYPTLTYDFGGDIPAKTYSTLDFTLGMTRQEQIYDTTYNCIALSGNGSFLTRNVMDTDTLDSSNVKVDLSSDEENELFKNEVSLRYE